jgi:hypothetical protein
MQEVHSTTAEERIQEAEGEQQKAQHRWGVD